ncbi:4'-phosphopantetheinyl transferase superfamily protein [Paraburkholderia bonniea]|uniref:4'-phosphopantetheinyl transferase family protein n=1 Tax=Paraburkholderia bonniea TaxID=2152891 RepID=UPI0012922200|nr:4'-phosphopantetheinyl transferase superfamily protein [Paraburkholderia bonniea]WJF91879.1 4'-phosphopantetheinyl transferase superfamily protein [Paraburkholderia bonniea]WJF95198.1 4'-phosphopantetheinyl transferase superfamily protein [Paraburkholderia bonniea]
MSLDLLLDSLPGEPVRVAHAGPSGVALWRVAIALDAALDSRCFAMLTADERQHAERFLRHEDAARFAAVRAALRVLLARLLGCTPHELVLTRDAHGRPQLASGAAALDFNVSHSGGYGLIALSTVGRVGVDIEQRRADFDWRAVAALTLDHAEQVALAACATPAAQNHAFYDSWVAKEALLKAAGVGVVEGLHIAPLTPRTSEQVAWCAAARARWPEFAAAWVAMPDGYAACVAWSERL